MHWNKRISLIGVHAEGEIGRVVTGGVLNIPGGTLVEKMTYINRIDDSLLRFCLMEPRGSTSMTVNVLLPPVSPEAHAAFIPLQPDGAHAMSGSNCMCVVTTLLETGMLPMQEPETEVVLETPAGLIRTSAQCANGKCEQVALRMPPSFVDQMDVCIDIDGLGLVRMDIVFGGCFFALVDISQFGIVLHRTIARKLTELGTRIHDAVSAALTVVHPEIAEFDSVDYVMFTSQDEGVLRNCNIMRPGRIDRSPCGTGSAARMALMLARQQVTPGQEVTMHSLIDSRFTCTVIEQTRVGDNAAAISRIAGRAWIYSTEEIGLDPSDPYPLGHALLDT